MKDTKSGASATADGSEFHVMIVCGKKLFLLLMRVGLTIGTVYCGVPTVADDLLYLSRSIIER